MPAKVKVSKRKFYRSVFIVEVLSEDELPNNMDLRHVLDECENGAFSGDAEHKSTTKLTGRQAAKALQKQGSDPGFFGLTDKGEDVDD